MSTVLPEIEKYSKRFMPFLNNKIVHHRSNKPMPLYFPPPPPKEVHLLRQLLITHSLPLPDKPFDVSALFSEVLGQCWKLKFITVFIAFLPQCNWTPVYSGSYWTSELLQRVPDPGDKTNRVVYPKIGKFSEICLVICLLRSQWCAVWVEELSFSILIWATLSRLLFPSLLQRNDVITWKT